MRLPVSHPPPGEDSPRLRCAHLEALANAAIGIPLTPAAELVAAARSRGRHGNALQWHLGLEAHDGEARLDWEDRIEVKLVTVWRSASGPIASDKLKVCDATINPWSKLSNVLWVFADRVTRMVVGSRFWHLAGPARERLEACWTCDPHFDRPDLFVEAREQDGRAAPAYYVTAKWLAGEVLPGELRGVLPFDGRWWTEARRASSWRDPRITCVDGGDDGPVACPRCRGTVTFDRAVAHVRGWAPARHAMPLGELCATREHVVVRRDRLAVMPDPEIEAGLVGTLRRQHVYRLADRVPEPDDHLH